MLATATTDPYVLGATSSAEKCAANNCLSDLAHLFITSTSELGGLITNPGGTTQEERVGAMCD